MLPCPRPRLHISVIVSAPSVPSPKFCSRSLSLPPSTDSSISLSKTRKTARFLVMQYPTVLTYFVLLVSFLCVFHKVCNVGIHGHGYSIHASGSRSVALHRGYVLLVCSALCEAYIPRDLACVMSKRNVISLCHPKDAFLGFVFLSARNILLRAGAATCCISLQRS